jgi:hypothetical protein
MHDEAPVNDLPEQRHGCDFPDCEMLARTTPMALRAGDGVPRVVRFCARHELLFTTGDPDVTAWIEVAPPGADAVSLAVG